ncbi:DUF6445 family protein [Novosphingobium sp. MMS21-SN21R]|uniref:DUF6445 family protein n=1 Tax=Novosphingobium sp. MMS21-SN21R TaxID=2969298 RepID=UPI002887603C|nr:DUF6445 family protein [Novosphingobium sp. MMS21-SN21R]MDT0507653.1 DUF6445 family protein [Novosphingobium sp. MMS21-SN21R]
MSGPLSLSPAAQIHTDWFGTEQQPIVVVDSALDDPHRVVAIAAQHDFTAIGPFYPGLRAAVSERIAMELVRPLLPELEVTFGLALPPRFLECYLSLLTTPSERLQPIQRFPHFDGLEAERLAVLLYLDAAESTGTGFYRQRDTGFESVDAARFEHYRRVLEAEVAALGLPNSGYIGGDSAHFERTFRVSGLFNRMVIYRGHALHCADIPAGYVPDANPQTGRLTLNLFLA